MSGLVPVYSLLLCKYCLKTFILGIPNTRICSSCSIWPSLHRDLLLIPSKEPSSGLHLCPVAVFYFYLDPLSLISGKASVLRFYQFISVSWSVYCGLIALNPPQHFINLVSNSRQLKTIHPNRISAEKCTLAHGFCTVILIFKGIFSCMTVLIWLLPHNNENHNEVLLPGSPSSPFNLLLL